MKLTIEKLVFEGHGLARDRGRVCFVEGGLPGEVVEATVTREAKSHAFARADRVLKPSPHRVHPPCPVFGQCGGCALLHLAYGAQLEAKRGFLREALHGVPALDGLLPAVCPSPAPLGFRNRMSFTIAARGKRAIVGLHARGRPDLVVSARSCVLPSAEMTRAVEAVEDALGGSSRPPSEWPARMEVRESRATGRRMAWFDRCGSRALAMELGAACGGCESVLFGHPGRRGRILRGEDHLVERLGGFEFKVGPDTFFQTNTAQAERLFEEAARRIAQGRPRRVLELYAGVGALTAFLSGAAREVTAVEGARAAAAAGAENMRRNGIRNAGILWADASRLPAAIGRATFDAVVADPPRAGLAPGAMDYLVRSRPALLLYVSCHPPILARDVRRLSEAGYRLTGVVPFDMFPQTFHVETLAVLER